MRVDTSSVVVGLAHFSHSMSSENSIRGKSSEKGNDLITVDLIAVVGATIAFTDIPRIMVRIMYLVVGLVV